MHTSKLIDALIERKQYPQQAFPCSGEHQTVRQEYGNECDDAACRKAYITYAITPSAVDSILKHQLY